MGISHFPRWARWLSAALLALAAFALLSQLAVYLHYSISLFRFPFDYDQGEGFELYDTVLHAHGEWPYRDSQVFPFYTSIYPPLFHLITAPLVAVFGPHLWTGRVVGFTASLIAAAAIGWGVWRASERRFPLIAAFSSLAFLASNYTFSIGPLFRQHMTMVMFETLAIVVLAQVTEATFNRNPLKGAGEREGRKENEENPLRSSRPLRLNIPFWLGLLFLLAAGYSKPLALATVLAALGYLFLRGPRRAVLTGIGLALAAGVIFLWINWQTGGWWYVSIIRANLNDYSLDQTIGFYREWLELHAVLALAAFGGLIYETYFSRLSIYSVWFAFAFANGALSGKFGAGESYFVTTTAAACILSGILAAKAWSLVTERVSRRDAKTQSEIFSFLSLRPWRSLRFEIFLALALPALSLIQTRLTFKLYTEGPIYGPLARALGLPDNSGRGFYDSQGYTQLGPRPTRADHEAGYTIVELARHAPGPVFSEEAAFMFRAGKPVVTNPFVQLVMYQAGLFDPTEEIALINRRAFGLVILRAQFYPPPVLAALGANYQPKTEIQMNGFSYRILEPRP